ncbi:MAG: tRNA1(Val) (adenine(37)-N6)-methyltransferase [Actinomycetota bacterium]|nr:tRNA1(Val) (adenine(37)-N6)-methyltransferase [Actinomycetota bacterium]
MRLTLDGIRDIRLYQREKGYRFSLDALLVESFVRMPGMRLIADLGAGSGIIGLLLAMRYTGARVFLVEIQKGLFELALRNIEINGLSGRVVAINADLASIGHKGPGKFQIPAGLKDSPVKDLTGAFDLVVSNPPFRAPSAGRLSEDQERAIARHELAVTLRSLTLAASRLLKSGGKFCMIHHPERLAEIMDTLQAAGLAPKRLRFVHGGMDMVSKMVLIESVKGARGGLAVEKPLIVYQPDGSYTPEIAAMYESEANE